MSATDIISVVIGGGALILSFIVFFRSQNKDNDKSSEERGALNNTLQNLVSTVGKIDTKMDYVSQDVTELRERVVRVEESTKQAHKRLDEIKK